MLGAVIPWMDYNGLVSFDSNYYAHMNNQTLSDANSPFNGQVLTDCSGRYLVGFGTDGGANIHSAAWSASPVGNAGHTVNLEHQHGSGTLKFKTAYLYFSSPNYYLQFSDSGGSWVNVIGYDSTKTTGATTGTPRNMAGGGTTFYTKDGSGNTDNQLSTTQSIQPRSIACRFLMRIK
jgi:hypothetical protein